MFSALRESLKTDCSPESVQINVLAGLTVGVIALPLSMALAIASGVAPQYGLYTAAIAGIVIALTGGSRVNIPGPTAAFVVVLLPIVQHYGLGGLLFSGFMAGIILILMGLSRFGGLIEVVPYPVTIGFTAGIGVVIGTIQVKDFFGLDVASLGEHYIDKVVTLFYALPTIDWKESLVGFSTLAILALWPRLKSRVPGHLVALLVVSVIVALAGSIDSNFSVATIGSRFHYDVAGLPHGGIPPFLPTFEWPWNQPGANGNPIGLSFDIVHSLIGAALTIAVLGSIESLLCAVAADGMSGQKHNPNDELIGQGIGNMIVPLFGGIPATAAIARTAASVRAGATSPVAAVVHALFILASIIFLAEYLAYIPMASIAALLLMVAWNMSEVKHFIRIVRIAPRDDVITLLTCFLLTVVFDMVIAVGVGMGLAAMLFIRRSIQLTRVDILDHDDVDVRHEVSLPRDVAIYEINGPLFFGSAQKALSEISLVSPEIRVVILDMARVSMLDMSAIVAMESIVKDFEAQKRCLVINALQPRMILKLRRAGVRKKKGSIGFSRTIEDAVHMVKNCRL